MTTIKKEFTKTEIEQNINGLGDFVKVDHLERFLKQADSIDIKRFILLKMAEIYEKRGMFTLIFIDKII